METKELIKKYWFVAVLALVLLVFIGMYSYETYQNREIKVSNKVVDGKYVAYSIDGYDYYADDLYDTLYETSGESQALSYFQRKVLEQAYETTDDMKSYASVQATNIISSYSESYLDSYLKSRGYENGYDDLTQFYIDAQKHDLLMQEYLVAHQDEIAETLGTNPRVIYHILVKCDVTEITDEDGNVTGYEANPTDEQKEKLANIQEALAAEDAMFEYVAYQYSDDSSSSKGGYIGLANEETAYTKFVPEFASVAMTLAEDEVSEPVVSQYGYHIIWNAGSSFEKILADSYYLSELETANPVLGVKAIMAKAEKINFVIKDEDLLAQINSELESEAE